MLKRLFCKHEWTEISRGLFPDRRPYEIHFGCIKCGKTEDVSVVRVSKWMFKQKHKGAVFNDE